LRTRGRLERTAEHWDRAEEALLASAAVLFKGRNLAGWGVSTDVAELTFDRGHFRQALTVAAKTVEALRWGEGRKPIGRPALPAARAAWRLAQHEAAAEFRQALNDLTWALGRIRARDFEGVLATLHGWPK